ncbi:hypothetical protein Pmani_016386 [Petrolisthes manimaculis]|uniref:Uncharacterized protein n=1 Tax=Petrolisthes manimaculis TaxID=1843537 RepID=A0AAE1PSD9_9EUCA|nr:hypothetical protein Pmani_016386 [Petrolisthes manimaculis]
MESCPNTERATPPALMTGRVYESCLNVLVSHNPGETACNTCSGRCDHTQQKLRKRAPGGLRKAWLQEAPPSSSSRGHEGRA